MVAYVHRHTLILLLLRDTQANKGELFNLFVCLTRIALAICHDGRVAAALLRQIRSIEVTRLNLKIRDL